MTLNLSHEKHLKMSQEMSAKLFYCAHVHDIIVTAPSLFRYARGPVFVHFIVQFERSEPCDNNIKFAAC